MSLHRISVYAYSDVWALLFCNITLFIFLKIDFLFHLKWFLKLTRFFNRRSWKFVQIWNQYWRSISALNSPRLFHLTIRVIELLLTFMSMELSRSWRFGFDLKMRGFRISEWFGEIDLLSACKVVFSQLEYKIGMVDDVEHLVMLVGEYLHKLRAHRSTCLLFGLL